MGGSNHRVECCEALQRYDGEPVIPYCLEKLKEGLGELIVEEYSAAKSWYKAGLTDIPVLVESRDQQILPLSELSIVVREPKPSRQVLLFAAPEAIKAARAKREQVLQAA